MQPGGGVAAVLGASLAAERLGRTPGDDVDDPAAAVGAEAAGPGTAQDLDPFDVAEIVVADLILRLGPAGVAHFDTVDEHAGVARPEPANADRLRQADAALAAERQPGHEVESVLKPADLLVLDVFGRDSRVGAGHPHLRHTVKVPGLDRDLGDGHRVGALGGVIRPRRGWGAGRPGKSKTAGRQGGQEQ